MRLKKLLVVRSQRRKKCGPWLPEDFHKTDNSPGLGGLKPWNESFDTVQSKGLKDPNLYMRNTMHRHFCSKLKCTHSSNCRIQTFQGRPMSCNTWKAKHSHKKRLVQLTAAENPGRQAKAAKNPSLKSFQLHSDVYLHREKEFLVTKPNLNKVKLVLVHEHLFILLDCIHRFCCGPLLNMQQ